jgi:hypothetical protein
MEGGERRKRALTSLWDAGRAEDHYSFCVTDDYRDYFLLLRRLGTAGAKPIKPKPYRRKTPPSPLDRPPVPADQNLMRKPAVGEMFWVAGKPFARPP